MQKKKTIMVILDGLDYEYIEKNLKQFPFYKKLLRIKIMSIRDR